MSVPKENFTSLPLPPSDLFNMETRPEGYHSFIYDIHSPSPSWPIKDYTVTFECHQAVLNEISSRPSNFGYGLGVALNKLFNKATESFKTVKTGIFGKSETCPIGDDKRETQLEELKECVEATETLRERLFSLEQTELAQYHCFVKSGHTPLEAREFQWRQQPQGYRPHSEHFLSVESSFYHDRGIRHCPKETAERREAAFSAEAAEHRQRKVCK